MTHTGDQMPIPNPPLLIHSQGIHVGEEARVFALAGGDEVLQAVREVAGKRPVGRCGVAHGVFEDEGMVALLGLVAGHDEAGAFGEEWLVWGVRFEAGEREAALERLEGWRPEFEERLTQEVVGGKSARSLPAAATEQGHGRDARATVTEGGARG